MRSASPVIKAGLWTSALPLSFLLACGGSDKPAETGGYQQGQPQPYAGAGGAYQAPSGYGAGGAAQPAPGYAGAPAAYAGAPVAYAGAPAGYAGAPVLPGLPTALPPVGTPPAASSGGSATPIDPAAGAVVQPIINTLAQQHTVAGAKPVGSVLVGNFQAGQTLEGQIQLQPQKCYTVVASALPPVTELNVQLVATTIIPNVSPVLATDSDTGTQAIIGKKPNCYRWPFPLAAPAKVILTVASGAGLAAVQVYEK